jgi:GntR family transcriptional regulator, transcriptional repressor for pyruvate dehydrogenase complex
MFKDTIKTTLYQDIVQQISKDIKQGIWQPGQRLPGELGLASHFEVSRNCIREALKAMELAGILESKPGRGTYVTFEALRRIEQTELLKLINGECTSVELMETRLVLEPQVAFLAAERANKADKESLALALKNLIDCLNNKSDWSNVGFEFHLTIARIARNRILTKLLSSLSKELKAQRETVYNKNPGDEAMILEHVKIYEAIVNRHPAQARDAMSYHLFRSLQIIIEMDKVNMTPDNTSNNYYEVPAGTHRLPLAAVKND